MPNAVLDRLEEQRAEQLTFVDQLLARVDAEGRDLVDAERANLTAARQRVTEIDQQLVPLREFEALREASSDGTPFPPTRRRSEPQPLDRTAATAYRSAGAFLVDHLRARGMRSMGIPPDPNAAARIERAAVDNQTTPDTPGVLPQPVIGPIVNTIDASRPFVTSIGARSMGGIPGTQFSRPKVTQHVDVGKQAAEKTQLASRRMKILSVPFVKETYGGTVDISRQDIDWTSPAAWDALVQDLADVYGGQTEIAASTAFAAAVLQTVPAATADLEGIAAALYAAAVKCYRGGAAAGTLPLGKLPNRLWVSLDMWAAVGAIVDVARLVVPPGGVNGNLGSSELASFSGDVLNVPRVVVPGFPDGTVVLGTSTLFEFYEEQIGLLSAVEPSILGVEVAYGGYAAYGMLEANAFCKVTMPAAGP